ncbi:transmembrane protein 222 [Diaphorina citri]|jgi:Protein of unknown function (DUF778).|uniref:Transmembrane protein 222 n=1 Tax=Diaphorina citri TaxID=121845 RepID=A0A1S3D715_DIACI|nr:transmembrane protein 222 [Diaphorina citri]
MVPNHNLSSEEAKVMAPEAIDVDNHKFPFCIVWTPLPLISYVLPIIGHMGICTSRGVIRDFAGSYHVSEDDMAFGWPTKYVQLNPSLANKGVQGWDDAIQEASEIYKHRTHNLLCDNCHSHVATALNLMNYNGSNSWNMVKLGILVTFKSKYVGFSGFLKQWVPFCILAFLVFIFYYYIF